MAGLFQLQEESYMDNAQLAKGEDELVKRLGLGRCRKVGLDTAFCTR